MAVSQNRRRWYFVDNKIQGALLREAGGLWLWGSLAFALIIVLCRVLPASPKTHEFQSAWYHLSPLVFASVLVFPILIFRATRFSHRIVGPMIRFRSALQHLARGEAPPDLALRENDFWSEIADDFNDLSARIAKLQALQDERNETDVSEDRVSDADLYSVSSNSGR